MQGIGQKQSTQPLVTFLVPCYNSATYMARCIESLLPAADACEIIIVNDGSTDGTLAIAQGYAGAHENIRVIDQENSGWGGGVNKGLAAARGLYFKVVDSDDYLDAASLALVIATLHERRDAGEPPDLLITNYVYDHVSDGTQHLTHYRKLFPQGRPFGWSEVGHAATGQYLMIHAAWYRTDILRASEVNLPLHASYMDSLLILHPLPYVKTLYYLDCPAYHYLTGREGQSVSVEVLKKHIDQQLLATKLAIDDYDFEQALAVDENMAETMAHYIICMMSVSNVYLLLIGTPEALEKNEGLWAYMKERNPKLYERVNWSIARLCHRRNPVLQAGVRKAYALAQHIFKFA